MTREEIMEASNRNQLRIEVETSTKMMKECGKVLRQLDMGATAKIIEDQAERTQRKLDEVLPKVEL